ncbi:MAG: energy transducer TonB [Gammaproteobacteria bacterium]|nr:energy transducer TonB [Gammaproteobacteria bacterium]
MDLTENIPGFTKTDRLGLTAFVSVLVHMTLILGVSFAVPDLRSNDPLPTLDITLVTTSSETAPEDADFLAQANREGGGDTDEAVIARTPLPVNPSPDVSEPAPQIQARSEQREPQPVVEQILTQDREPAKTIDDRTPREEQADVRPTPDAAAEETDQIARERAQLTAELSDFWQEYQKRPRRKFLSARTREYKYAEYMEAWRSRVERVGNLNYPEKARRQNLTGDLVLDVAIKPDGSVHELNMVKSSGNKVLDDAARRIVKLAAPYDAFPSDIKKEVDILHITRTWQFMRDNRLVSR